MPVHQRGIQGSSEPTYNPRGLASTRSVAVLTREYPPEVYGGAGTHVEYLVRELRKPLEGTVHCGGSPSAEAGVKNYRARDAPAEPKTDAAATQAEAVAHARAQ